MDLHGSSSTAHDPSTRTRNTAEASSSQHTQACRRCREQKLRCSHDLPICKRCERVAAVCIFPDPPDRKLLATQRIRKPRILKGKRPKPYQVKGNEAPTYELSPRISQLPELGDAIPSGQGLRVLAGNHRLQEREHSSPSGPDLAALTLNSISSDNGLPSAELSMIFIEAYFDSVYNAALLFHKDSFISDYVAERIPKFVLLSIYALASIFSRRPQEKSQSDEYAHQSGSLIFSHLEFSGQALTWATTATKQVLMQVDEPRLETIQACQNLALYWFSVNQIKKTHMLTNIAYTTSSILGYHVLGSSKDQVGSFDAEKKRRCFWSCWMTSCISQDNAHFKGESWAAVVGLPFPSDERYFAAEQPEISETFNEIGGIVSLHIGTTPRPSYFGELVKLFSLWWEIQNFVRRHLNETSNDSSAVLVILLRLDRKLELIFEKLHPHFKYTGPKSFTSKSPNIDAHQLFALNALYQLCSCVLHSSIVPLFSSDFPEVEISKKLTRMYAEEAVKQSSIALEMANAYRSIYPDGYCISGITAYSMFVSSTIQMRSLRAQKKLRTHLINLKGAISIIKRVKDFWYPVRGMWANLDSVFRSTGMNVNHILADSDHLQPRPVEIRTDIDQIISNDAKSEQGAGPDIYTYAPSQVATGKSSQKSASSHASPTADVTPNTRSSIFHRPRVREMSSNNDWPIGTGEEQLGSNIRFTTRAMSQDQQASNVRTSYFNPDRNVSQYQATSSDAYPSPSGLEPIDAIGQEPRVQKSQIIPDGSGMSATDFMEDLSQAYLEPGMDMINSGNVFWWDQSLEGMDRDPFGLLRGGFPQPMEGMWFEPPP